MFSVRAIEIRPFQARREGADHRIIQTASGCRGCYRSLNCRARCLHGKPSTRHTRPGIGRDNKSNGDRAMIDEILTRHRSSSPGTKRPSPADVLAIAAERLELVHGHSQSYGNCQCATTGPYQLVLGLPPTTNRQKGWLNRASDQPFARGTKLERHAFSTQRVEEPR
jgi:hypothetical protein